ncbi:MAG: hypothetical protein WBV77_07085 [Solirubrobacteraceae bacterium]|jgi:hypothetical protein
MPKPVPLTPAVLEAPQITPQAATLPRTAAKPVPPKAPKAPQIPLQVRLPRDEVRAIKIAAAEREQTVSDFMLACFHAYMKSGERA